MLSSKAGPSWQRNAKKPTHIKSLWHFKSGRTGLNAELCSRNDPRMSVRISNRLHSSPAPYGCVREFRPFTCFRNSWFQTHTEHYSLSAVHANIYLFAYVMTNTFLALFTYSMCETAGMWQHQLKRHTICSYKHIWQKKLCGPLK